MSTEEVDQINLEMLEQAVPNRPEMVSFIWQLGKAFEKYKIFARLVDKMSFESAVAFVAKIFHNEEKNPHFYWKFMESEDNFMQFLQKLDYKNQALFLDFLFKLE